MAEYSPTYGTPATTENKTYPSQPGQATSTVGYPANYSAYPSATPAGYPAYPSAYPPQYTAQSGSESTPLHAGGGGYYPSSYGVHQGYQHPQQGVVVVVGQPTVTGGVVIQPYVSYTGYIVLSCLVFWFCGILFGLIAFVLAVMAQSTWPTDLSAARRLARASLVVSMIGILVGIAVILAVLLTNHHVYCAGYYINGLCYRHRDIDYNHDDCYQTHPFGSYYEYPYCYYDY